MNKDIDDLYSIKKNKFNNLKIENIKDCLYNIEFLKKSNPNKTNYNYKNDDVFLFFPNNQDNFKNFKKSFFHCICMLYNLLFIYLSKKLDKKIVIPFFSEKHFSLQFIKLFINNYKIILIKDLNNIYNFKSITELNEIRKDIEPLKYKIIINRVNRDLFKKLKSFKFKIKKHNKILINRNNKNTLVEDDRLFDNYEESVNLIKKIHPDTLLFEPSNYSLIEQIYLIHNCKLLICDWGSSLTNMLWLKQYDSRNINEEKSKCICIIHPWMCYFHNRNEFTIYGKKSYIWKEIDFIRIYTNTFYKNKILYYYDKNLKKYIKSIYINKFEGNVKDKNNKNNDDYKYIIRIKDLRAELRNIKII